MLVDKGSCLYEWHGGRAHLTRGGLIYLAANSARTVTVIDKPFSFYRIYFVLKDPADGEQIVFSENPWVVSYEASHILFDICNEMCRAGISRNRIYKIKSLLYEFFHNINKVIIKEKAGKILPATDYIERHYTEETDISFLASKCYMSRSHFFRVFKEETGKTPVEYRNYIRMERAKSLLSGGECSVGDIASILGFENIYYFSRMFKKIVGVSPSGYINNENTH